MSDTTFIKVGPQGRIVIPAYVRRRLGLDEGTEVAVQIKDGGVFLITPEEAGRQLQAMFKDVPGSMADELIAERRAEVERERAEDEARRSRT